MSASPLATRRLLTSTELEQQGFTAEQIAQLDWLRTVYPFVEYFGTSQQAKRLQFLKWMHETGRLDA
jgi:hypothetical protein